MTTFFVDDAFQLFVVILLFLFEETVCLYTALGEGGSKLFPLHDGFVIQHLGGGLDYLHPAALGTSQLFGVKIQAVIPQSQIMTLVYVGAYSPIAMEISYPLDDFSIVIDPTEHDMAVRMILVCMPHDYIRSIGSIFSIYSCAT